jgi:hypothetical protein
MNQDKNALIPVSVQKLDKKNREQFNIIRL